MAGNHAAPNGKGATYTPLTLNPVICHVTAPFRIHNNFVARPPPHHRTTARPSHLDRSSPPSFSLHPSPPNDPNNKSRFCLRNTVEKRIPYKQHATTASITTARANCDSISILPCAPSLTKIVCGVRKTALRTLYDSIASR